MFKSLLINVFINWAILYFVNKYDLWISIENTKYDLYLTFLILWFIFWLFNFVFKNLLKILTLPLKIITFGLSSLVINVFVVYLFEYVVNNYDIWISVTLGSILEVIILSFIITFFYILIKK